ncbi:5-methylcytosine-specific restriction protein B [Sphingobium sp. B2D3A]|uniref:AAA family ATPase n=1 Tax=unclassified Sphingobium TaxID=2611147 RepID=UPI0022257E6A|nr:MULTISPECIES: AAA family ATPase [unclassified Sphingobium]MCW2338226.1 5-methylcytosine-specific restriction protein B [Sphingobium sp. B2D3A]MCW2384684.1 5-methylcytosine-specific restriction protein B [Sphingobium sp. B2D3D]
MKEQEFKDWLSRRLWKGEPLTKKGINTRVRRSLRAERGLKGLGFSQTTLDEVFDAGKWEELLAKLTELANDPKPDMAIVRAVVPQADDPNGQLSNMIAGLKQYGYFREGRDPNYAVAGDAEDDANDESQADRIRRYVLDNYIIPARADAQPSVTITVGALNNEMGLHMAWPNICQALEGRLFLDLAKVPPPAAEGPKQSTTRKLTYSLTTENVRVIRPKQSPTNLILYGPPGTGKTYRTAYEAVSLCDGTVAFDETPSGREALLERYRELEAEKRIAFVTFHQNYDYESFVEGLRPETGDEDGASGGFHLEARPGIFREICALADQSRTRPTSATTTGGLDLEGRRFWKMGQGAIGSEDDVYDAALANNYIALGWGGTIDWSPERFSSFEAIKAEWQDKKPDDPTPSNWTQTWPFRSEMKVGDIVIVPYGNTAFRAIAEVTGDYRYVPEAEGYYAHRRDVRWLLTLKEPLPLDTIIDGNFTQRTLYSVAKSRVNLAALARLIADDEGAASSPADGGEPDQFVLIIDEINRANISKVFGELITLIEPDKRLGMTNALSLTLPYSKKRDFGVPANLHIIGTMNTADRSIALLDTALRRRFTFRELAPLPDLLEIVEGVDLRTVLNTINDRIEYLLDREHRIGHAFFMGCKTLDAVRLVMRDKVIPLLQEYFFDDWSRIQAILGDGFIGSRKIAPPPGLEGEDRDSWFVREAFLDDAFERLRGIRPGTSAE